MAIKVGGTTVIDDSRQLTNIASVDATTVAALGTAGVGGGGTAEFVATGAIAGGNLVGLRPDGKVSVVSSPTGGTSEFISTAVYTVDLAYDTLNNKVAVFYRDENNSDQGTAVVGTVSGGSITFGTPVIFESSAVTGVKVSYDTTANKFLILYKHSANNNYFTARVGTVSGTSMSFSGTQVISNTGTTPVGVTYSSSDNKHVAFYTDDSTGNSRPRYAVLSISSGNPQINGTGEISGVFASGSQGNVVYDPNSGKFVFVYRDGSSGDTGRARVGTLSGSSITFGSIATIDSAVNYLDAAIRTVDGTVAVFYRDGSSGDGDKAAVSLGTISGTSISFTTRQHITTVSVEFTKVAYDPDADRFVFFYSNSSPVSGLYVVGSVGSGPSLIYGSPSSYSSLSGEVPSLAVTYDPDAEVLLFAYRSVNNSNAGQLVQISATNAAVFANTTGFAAESIADAATGKVTILGGINEELTGLTIGSKYYVQDDGSVTTTVSLGREIGRALSATKLLITQGGIT